MYIFKLLRKVFRRTKYVLFSDSRHVAYDELVQWGVLFEVSLFLWNFGESDLLGRR
jgi:hypothetical protein